MGYMKYFILSYPESIRRHFFFKVFDSLKSRKLSVSAQINSVESRTFCRCHMFAESSEFCTLQALLFSYCGSAVPFNQIVMHIFGPWTTWFGLLEFILNDRGGGLQAKRLILSLILSHPYVYMYIEYVNMARTTFVARQGIEHFRDKHLNHKSPDLALIFS